jgi:hypothetical protein
VENLSHEHVATCCGDEVVGVGTSVRGGPDARSARSTAPHVDPLASVPAEAPPPGLWSKIEAQLRHEGVIH